MVEIERLQVGQRMSQAVIHGDLVFLAGQCGESGDDIATQTQTALQKIDALLQQAGSDREHILNTTIWLADISDYDALNEVWDAWMPEGCAPARACGEARLGGTGYLVEIICIAARA